MTASQFTPSRPEPLGPNARRRMATQRENMVAITTPTLSHGRTFSHAPILSLAKPSDSSGKGHYLGPYSRQAPFASRKLIAVLTPGAQLAMYPRIPLAVPYSVL